MSSGLQLWQPQIIKSYGLTNMQTGLLSAIPFALASVIMIWWGSRSDRTGERIWHRPCSCGTVPGEDAR